MERFFIILVEIECTLWVLKVGYIFYRWKELERVEMIGVRKNYLFLLGLFDFEKIRNL